MITLYKVFINYTENGSIHIVEHLRDSREKAREEIHDIFKKFQEKWNISAMNANNWIWKVTDDMIYVNNSSIRKEEMKMFTAGVSEIHLLNDHEKIRYAQNTIFRFNSNPNIMGMLYKTAYDSEDKLSLYQIIDVSTRQRVNVNSLTRSKGVSLANDGQSLEYEEALTEVLRKEEPSNQNPKEMERHIYRISAKDEAPIC